MQYVWFDLLCARCKACEPEKEQSGLAAYAEYSILVAANVRGAPSLYYFVLKECVLMDWIVMSNSIDTMTCRPTTLRPS